MLNRDQPLYFLDTAWNNCQAERAKWLVNWNIFDHLQEEPSTTHYWDQLGNIEKEHLMSEMKLAVYCQTAACDRAS